MTPTIEQLADPAKMLDLLRSCAIAAIQEEAKALPEGHILLFTDVPDTAIEAWNLAHRFPVNFISALNPVDANWDAYAFGLDQRGILNICENVVTISEWKDSSADDLVILLGRIKKYSTPVVPPKAIIWFIP